MKKLSKLNESVWSDIRDRANCNTVKEEDDIIYTYLDLKKYIKSQMNPNSDVLDLRGFNLHRLNSLYTSSIDERLFNRILPNIKKIDVTGWKTSTITDMHDLFAYADVDEIIGLDTWDVSNVTDMNGMFFSTKIKKIDISNWELNSIKCMIHMFSFCKELKEVNIDFKINSTDEISMQDMFGNCTSIESLDLNNWNVSSVKDMGSMFSNCESLKILKIDDWDVSNVSDMTCMFEKCKSLEELNLEKWELADPLYLYNIFDGINSKCLYTKQGNKFIHK